MTKTQKAKIKEALKLPFDRFETLDDLSGKVVIFKDGEVFNGGVAMLVYEPENELLEHFKKADGFEQVLVP